jgi:hypothetical protein
MANKILASTFSWFRNSIFTPSMISKKNSIHKLKFNDGQEHEQHQKNVAALKLLEKKEKQFQKYQPHK